MEEGYGTYQSKTDKFQAGGGSKRGPKLIRMPIFAESN